MSQVAATATIQLVTVACAGASTPTTTAVIASTSVGLPGVIGWQDELLPPLIPMNTMKHVAGFTIVPQQMSAPQRDPAFLLSLRLMSIMPWVLLQ